MTWPSGAKGNYDVLPSELLDTASWTYTILNRCVQMGVKTKGGVLSLLGDLSENYLYMGMRSSIREQNVP